MRKALTTALFSLFSWINARRLLFLAVYFSFVYFTFLSPYISYAKSIGSPLGAFELFIILECLPAASPFIPLLALLWFADVPVLDDSTTSVIYRSGRKKWLIGQIVFVLGIIIAFQLCLLVLCFAVDMNTFLANGWSTVLRKAALGESEIGSSLTLDTSVLYQSRPFSMTLNCIGLTSLYMLMIALIQMIFTLVSKRIIGIIVSVLITGAGFGLCYIGTTSKWLLPLSHAIYTGHWDRVFNKAVFPLWGSYLYFAAVIIVLLCIAFRTVCRCSFHIVGGSEQ